MALRDIQEMFETALEPFDVRPSSFESSYRYVGPNRPFIPMGGRNLRFSEPGIDIADVARARVSEVLASPAPRAPPVIHPTVTVAPSIPERAKIFIDPEEAPVATVFETQPVVGGFERFPRKPSILDEIPTSIPTSVIRPAAAGGTMAGIDWGEIAGSVLGGIAGGLFDPVGLGSGVRGLVAGPASTVTGVPSLGQQVQPRTVTVDTVTGKVTVCRRRRRRRLLTETDFNDLMRIATLPNKDTVKIALAKAIGRR